jgi:hypothetical protein
VLPNLIHSRGTGYASPIDIPTLGRNRMRMTLVLQFVLLSAIVVSSAATPASAADWRLLEMLQSTGPQELAFIDEESMVTKDGVIRFWMQTLDTHALMSVIPAYETPEAKPFEDALLAKANTRYMPRYAAESKGKVTQEELVKMQAWFTMMELAANTFRYKTKSKFFAEIDCASRNSRVTSILQYRDDGELKGSSNLPNAQFSPILPDSMFDDARRWYCK